MARTSWIVSVDRQVVDAGLTSAQATERVWELIEELDSYRVSLVQTAALDGYVRFAGAGHTVSAQRVY